MAARALQNGCAVLPHGLQRAVAPAIALPPELAPGRRRLGPGQGPLLVHHTPAGPVHGDGDVGVLGEGVLADAADVDQRPSAEGADGARDRRHAVEDVVEAAVEVEPHDVLDVLPAADEAAAVGDLGVARHGPHTLVSEGAREPREGVGFELGIGVDADDELVVRQPQPGVEGGRLPGVYLAHHVHPGQTERLDDVGGAICRAVVDDDHLQVGIATVGEGHDSGGDADRLVEGGHENRHRRPIRRR